MEDFRTGCLSAVGQELHWGVGGDSHLAWKSPSISNQQFKSDGRQLYPGCQIGSLLTGIRYPLGGFAAFHNGHIARLDKLDGLDITEPDTLRVAVADIALENPPIGGIVIHGAEGTYADT